MAILLNSHEPVRKPPIEHFLAPVQPVQTRILISLPQVFTPQQGYQILVEYLQTIDQGFN